MEPIKDFRIRRYAYLRILINFFLKKNNFFLYYIGSGWNLSMILVEIRRYAYSEI